MRYIPVLRSLAIAAACMGADAHAQIDQFSLNFEEIKIDYRNAETGALPFTLDLVHGEQGEVTVRSASNYDVTLKRGTFFPADPLPEAWLFFDVRAARATPGVLALGIDQSTSSSVSGGPKLTVLSGNPSQGTAVHVGGVNVVLSDGSVRFVRDSINVRLSGQPAELFNRPAPGEALEARLPTPAVGQTIELVLIVADDRGASMRLPVRITRPR